MVQDGDITHGTLPMVITIPGTGHIIIHGRMIHGMVPDIILTEVLSIMDITLVFTADIIQDITEDPDFITPMLGKENMIIHEGLPVEAM